MKQLILATLLLACNRPTFIASNPVTTVNGSTILLGKVTVQHLQQPPFKEWYDKEYASYSPDARVKDSLASLISPYRFEIFLGTWCGDSKREVPRLLRVLNELGVKSSSITIISVGNSDTLYKQSPGHEEKDKNIFRVPHLNIYRNGNEVGRITETPVLSWEKDMLSIISGRNYVPTHALLMKAGSLIEAELSSNAEVSTADVLIKMRSLALPNGQLLNSYGLVRLYGNQFRPAFLAFTINNQLFPEALYTYSALANYYRVLDNNEQEKFWLNQLLQKKPGDEYAKKRMAVIN